MKEDPTRTGEMRKAQGRYLLPHLMIESTTGPYAVATFSKSNEIYDNQADEYYLMATKPERGRLRTLERAQPIDTDVSCNLYGC